MNMSIFNKKIRLPLLVVFLVTAIGALSGQLVWALIASLGLWALEYVAQNLSGFLQGINARGRTTFPEADGAILSSLDNRSDWLQEWEEDMRYSPSYRGTPGNIWNGPKWTSDDWSR